MQRKVLLYDKSGEEHFNLISALHKSVRSSDPDAALYWLARMLEAGEDRLYIARRLVRMAIEDIGLADPRALEQCIAVKEAVHFLGIPEGDLALAQAAIYLCVAPKIRRRLSRLGRGQGRRGEDDRGAGPDAPAQRAHEIHEGSGDTAKATSTRTNSKMPSPIWNACRRRWPDGSITSRPIAAWKSEFANGWRRSASCGRRSSFSAGTRAPPPARSMPRRLRRSPGRDRL